MDSLNGLTIALKDLPTNDLARWLNLLDCPPAPEGLTAGTPSESSVALSWTAVSNASRYRVERRVRNTRGFGAEDPGARDWVVDDDTLTVTSHTLSGLNCRWEYSFRVSAYGNGTDYGADWGEPSDVLSSSGGECVPPTFGAISILLLRAGRLKSVNHASSRDSRGATSTASRLMTPKPRRGRSPTRSKIEVATRTANSTFTPVQGRSL